MKGFWGFGVPSRARFDTTPRARLHRVTCSFTPRHVRLTLTALQIPYGHFLLATLPAYERNTTTRTPLTLRVRFGNKRHSAGLIRLRVSLSSTTAGTRQSSTPTASLSSSSQAHEQHTEESKGNGRMAKGRHETGRADRGGGL